jgi:hypothetical protein
MDSRLMAVGLAVTAATVAGGGCGSTPTSPTPPPPAAVNARPVIASMSVTQSSYRTGRISASASDSDGPIASGTVDWGDGTTTNVTRGFASISLTHRYDSAQSFPITLRVADDQGAAAQQTQVVQIAVPPETCVDIQLIEGCARVSSDFQQVTLLFQNPAHLIVGSFQLSDGLSGAPMHLLAWYGDLEGAVDLRAGRITLTGKVCAAPLVCGSIGTTVIQF